MSTTHHALLIALVFSLSMAFPSAAAERQIMAPRVPADKLEEARALTSPLPDSPGTIEKGKALYNGKGTCFNCHGKDGMGNGSSRGRTRSLTAQLSPSRVMAAPDRGRDFLGDQAWLAGNGHDRLRDSADGRGNLGDRALPARLRRRPWPARGDGPSRSNGGRHRANEECCASPAP